MTDLELTAADGHRLTAYRADPAGAPLGGVVIVQEIFGVNGHIRDVCDRAAASGYVAVAPALFDRIRRGVELDYDAEGVREGRDLAWNMPEADAIADLTAAAGHLGAELGGPERVGVVGFCYGGMMAAAMASRAYWHLNAAVAYYPSMAAQLMQADQPHVPLLVHLGALDTRVTPEDGAVLEARWPDATFHRYPAGHGFNCDRRADFDRPSADLAWERTVAFLGEHLGTDEG
jgi:carboxymethylenebutenolidase